MPRDARQGYQRLIRRRLVGILADERYFELLVGIFRLFGARAHIHPSDGIVIAPGFGKRGFDGKLVAAKFARTNDVPCLMIGLG